MKTLPLILIFCFIYAWSSAQNKNINNYKYIIVPSQFEMFYEKDKYRLNTLVRYMFKNEGFEVYFNEEELPNDLVIDRCLGLYTGIQKLKGGLFTTKMQISLKDCFGNVVMLSEIGESRQKEYQKAYSEALKAAFTSFKGLNYKYTPSNTSEQMAKEVVVKKTDNFVEKEEGQPANSIPKIKIEESSVTSEPKSSSTDFFQVRPITLGYEIIDNNGNVVMILLGTSSKDIFIVKDKSAIVYRAPNGEFMYSENDGNSIIQKPVRIKF